MVLGRLPVPGCLTMWMIIGQGPTALTADAGGDFIVSILRYFSVHMCY